MAQSDRQSAARPSRNAAASAATERSPRRRPDPARRKLGLAVVLVLVGSFLPWLFTGLGSISGARGPGLWTAYAAFLGLAALFMPWRRVAGVHAGLLAVVALVIPVWQLVHVIGLPGSGGWYPGPGLVVVVAGGVVAAAAARGMFRPL